MKSNEVEIAVSNLINYRTNTIVPNVSWGLGLYHECDMLVLDSQDRFTEIEIKVSASDLKADFKKTHGHYSKIISRLVYALPREIYEKHGSIIPRNCGVIVLEYIEIGERKILKATWERVVKHNKLKEKPSPKVIRKFMELGCMRIWTLKKHLNTKN